MLSLEVVKQHILTGGYKFNHSKFEELFCCSNTDLDTIKKYAERIQKLFNTNGAYRDLSIAFDLANQKCSQLQEQLDEKKKDKEKLEASSDESRKDKQRIIQFLENANEEKDKELAKHKCTITNQSRRICELEQSLLESESNNAVSTQLLEEATVENDNLRQRIRELEQTKIRSKGQILSLRTQLLEATAEIERLKAHSKK